MSFKKLKDLRQNAQNIWSGEKANSIYETYKNTVMPHWRYIYAKEYDMEKAKMGLYPHSDHALPHWKLFMWCCAKFPSVNLLDQ